MEAILLASTSPWRAAILERAGVPVRPVAPAVDESHIVDRDPAQQAQLRADAKAEAVREQHPRAWILGADQVVWDGRRITGKPTGAAEQLARLRSMRGQSHELRTAYCLLGPGVERRGCVRTRLWVRADVEESELAAYVATGEGRGCAGGYAAEGLGAMLFERIEGDWHNVIGLPLYAVLGELRAAGWRVGVEGWRLP